MSSLIGLAGGSTGADYYSYTVDNSLRLDYGSSGKLTRAWGAGGDTTEWTVSLWIKRCEETVQDIFGVYTDGNNYTRIHFNANGTLQINEWLSGANKYVYTTTQVFRDASAWGHLVIAVDTDQGVAGNRVNMYWNNVRITAFATETDPSSGQVTHINSNATHYLGARGDDSNYMDAYIAEFVFIDGEQLTPSSFGETNDDGIWVPKDVSGLTFDSTDVYLDFKVAPGTGNGAGTDVSGEANHFTDSGLTASDQMLDTPTENYCTLNPIANEDFTNAVYEEGALQINSSTGTGYASAGWGTMGVTTGKWYFEQTVVSEDTGSTMHAGVIEISTQPTANAVRTYMSNGQKYHSSSGASSYGTTWANDDVIGIAIDLDGGDIWFSLNDTWQASATIAEIAGGDNSNAAFTDLTGIEWTPGVFPQTGTQSLNCGQQAFAGTPPTGFLKINETNLAEHFDWAITKGSDYFSATLYTGTGATLDVDVGFDVTNCLAVTKNRDVDTDSFKGVNTVRGATKEIEWDNYDDTETTDADGLTAFGTVANNLRYGADTAGAGYNTSSEDYVVYTWKEDPVSGFDIAEYTGTGSATTFPHALNTPPRWFWVTSVAQANGRVSYHAGAAADAETDYLTIHNAGAATDDAAAFNDTAPTASVFSVGTWTAVNASEAFIAFLWADVPGFSRIGHYIGNGNANGPFIYMGMRPAFLIVKQANVSGSWAWWDSSRSPYNPVSLRFDGNVTQPEASSTTIGDFVSNGLKIRTTNSQVNTSGGRYTFSAWAENPFPRSKAR